MSDISWDCSLGHIQPAKPSMAVNEIIQTKRVPIKNNSPNFVAITVEAGEKSVIYRDVNSMCREEECSLQMLYNKKSAFDFYYSQRVLSSTYIPSAT